MLLGSSPPEPLRQGISSSAVPDISSPLGSLREKRKGSQLSFQDRKLIVDRVEYITQDLLGQCKDRKAAALEARRTVAHELNMHERTLQNYLKQKDAITMQAGIDGTWIHFHLC